MGLATYSLAFGGLGLRVQAISVSAGWFGFACLGINQALPRGVSVFSGKATKDGTTHSLRVHVPKQYILWP